MPQLTRRARERGRELMMAAPRSLTPFFREQFDRMSRRFDEFFGREEAAHPMARMWGPPMDIKETEHKVMVSVDIPGLKPEDIDISTSENILTVKGEKREEKEEKGEHAYASERRYGAFHRSVELPCLIDPDKVDASYHNGVLRIEMQKIPEPHRRKIQVKSQ
jgi:HSP20 family protein